MIEDLATRVTQLEAWGTARGWRGPDPYEGLNARRPSLLKRSSLGRRLLIQAVKRSPVDLRRALGIDAGLDSATLGHLLSAYARPLPLGAAERRERSVAIVSKLDELRVATAAGAGWGYHFDVETRFLAYSATTPNTIATAFVGHGLLDAADAHRDTGLTERAAEAGEFFLAEVPQTPGPVGAFFGYLPGDRTPIHNANLLVAALLARLGARTGTNGFLEAARSAIAYTVACQRGDGSWPYAETANGAWVDNFHTGYVLDALLACATALDDADAWRAYERGLDFYARELFEADGAPRYAADRLYPIDGQCVAQAIQTFALASMHDDRWRGRAWATYRFAVTRMLRGDGSFCFQRGRVLLNRQPHVRWVQAPMLAALGALAATATTSEASG